MGRNLLQIRGRIVDSVDGDVCLYLFDNDDPAQTKRHVSIVCDDDGAIVVALTDRATGAGPIREVRSEPPTLATLLREARNFLRAENHAQPQAEPAAGAAFREMAQRAGPLPFSMMAQAEPAAVCVCGHAKSEHEDDGGPCLYDSGREPLELCPCEEYRGRLGGDGQ